ncbi:MAG: IclR family transcriptional regulator [Bacillota bacterium]
MRKTDYEAKYPIKSLEKALEIINLLAGEARNGGLGISEIDERLKIGKSTIHRMLDTLMAFNYVEKNSTTNKYCLGWRLFEIGSNIPRQRNLYSFDMKILHDLSNKYGETVNLGVRDGVDVITVYKVDPETTLKANISIGGREALHATSMGKVLVSEMSPTALRDIFGEKVLKAYTQNTITTFDGLMEEIAKVREQGYAIDDEELCMGLRCVAMPIRNNQGNIVCALSVSGPSVRINYNKILSIKEDLQIVTKNISNYLGYRNIV